MLRKAQRLPVRERLELYEVMSTYADDSRSIIKLLQKKGARSAKKKVKHWQIYSAIGNSVSSESISNSLRPYIPDDEYIFIRSAESRSSISSTLRSLVLIVQSKNDAQTRFGKVIIKPFMFLVISLVLCAVVFYGLVPQIASIVEGRLENPFPLFVVNELNTFLGTALPFTAAGLIFASAYLLIRMPYMTSPLRAVFDRLSPVHVVYRDFLAAILLVSLGAAMRGGDSINTYFSTALKVAKPYEAKLYKRILDRLQDGNYSVAEALNIGLLHESDMEQIFDYTEDGADVVSAISVIGSRAVLKAVDRSEMILNVVSWSYMIIFLVFIVAHMGVAISAAMTTFSGIDFSNPT